MKEEEKQDCQESISMEEYLHRRRKIKEMSGIKRQIQESEWKLLTGMSYGDIL